MSELICLPTAADEPVRQQPRRGRLPRTVASISEARYRRDQLAEQKEQQEWQRGYDKGRKESQERRARLD